MSVDAGLKYRNFLRDAVSELCNADGAYEVWWDLDGQRGPLG